MGLHFPSSTRQQKFAAAALFAVLALTVLTANIGAIAKQPAAGSSGMFSGLGPGALGKIRFQLAQAATGKVSIDPQLARKALISSPLASDPFAALAGHDLNINPKGTSKDAMMLAEAVRRNPRSRPARILSLRMMASNGDLKGAFNQLAVFNRLNPELVEAIMEALTVRVQTPKQVDEAMAAIAGHDGLYLPFIVHMGTKKKPPEVVTALAQRTPANALANAQIRSALVQQLVDAGQIPAARKMWRSGVKTSDAALIHSPNFADAISKPPFNWELFAGSTGAAERISGGGLSIAYYDRKPGFLARQLVTFPAGAYRIFAEFEISSGHSDNVRLQMTCLGSGQQLGEAALVQSKPGLNRVALNVNVPAAGCIGQSLSIVGSASEQRGETQIIVRRIDVQQGGGTT